MFLPAAKRELDDARVLLYFKQLEPYAIEDVEAACFNLQGKLRKFPHPADILDELAEMQAKRRTASAGAPAPRPPEGDEVYCYVCNDSGWTSRRALVREMRDVDARDPAGDAEYTWAKKCACQSHNPIYRWRVQQNRAGIIRREEKDDNNWTPGRRGQLVRFPKKG